MVKFNYLILGLIVGFLINGCATLGFPYRFYGLDAVSYDGSLIGPQPTQDISLKECAPTETEKGKCVVMLREEFFKLKADYLNLQSQLKACQQGVALQ